MNVNSILSEEELAILGEDTVSSIEKVNKAILERKLKPLEEQLEEERKLRIKQAEERARREQEEANLLFLRRLGELVPDYEEIDTNPHFLAWMEEPDPYSGFARKYIFKQAQSIGDVGRVAQYFNEFKKLVFDKPKRELEKKITPEATGKETIQQREQKANPNRNKKIWTLKEIDAVYDSFIKGTFKGTKQERQRLEQEIDLAVAEGRVRQ